MTNNVNFQDIKILIPTTFNGSLNSKNIKSLFEDALAPILNNKSNHKKEKIYFKNSDFLEFETQVMKFIESNTNEKYYEKPHQMTSHEINNSKDLLVECKEESETHKSHKANFSEDANTQENNGDKETQDALNTFLNNDFLKIDIHYIAKNNDNSIDNFLSQINKNGNDFSYTFNLEIPETYKEVDNSLHTHELCVKVLRTFNRESWEEIKDMIVKLLRIYNFNEKLYPNYKMTIAFIHNNSEIECDDFLNETFMKDDSNQNEIEAQFKSELQNLIQTLTFYKIDFKIIYHPNNFISNLSINEIKDKTRNKDLLIKQQINSNEVEAITKNNMLNEIIAENKEEAEKKLILMREKINLMQEEVKKLEGFLAK